MRNRRMGPGLVVIVIVIVLAAGCATVRPSVEGQVSQADVSYTTGRALQDFAFPPQVVGTAVAESMDDLKMTSIARGRDGSVLKIDGKTADNRLVTVTIRHLKSTSKVSCRIGWFGDEPLSRALLERVAIRLGALPPAAIPENPPSSPAPNPIFSRDAIPDSVMLRDVAEAPYRDRVIP